MLFYDVALKDKNIIWFLKHEKSTITLTMYELVYHIVLHNLLTYRTNYRMQQLTLELGMNRGIKWEHFAKNNSIMRVVIKKDLVLGQTGVFGRCFIYQCIWQCGNLVAWNHMFQILSTLNSTRIGKLLFATQKSNKGSLQVPEEISVFGIEI